MLIRSQNKWNLVPFENYVIGIAKIDNKFRISAEAIDDIYELGAYSTEEKAIKVLDMIQESQRMICNSNGAIIINNKGVKQSEHYFETDRSGFVAEYAKCILFQMPQDGDV